MKKDRKTGGYTIGLGGDRAYTLTILPISQVNATVCQAEIHFAIGQDAPITSALNIWSFLHQPELILQANYVNVDPDGVKRVRKSWEHLASNSSTAVNFSTERKADDTPLNSRYDSGMLFYQERTF
jgi:4-alpha-glucanotransferase